jgi:hypothetical protein
MRKLPLIKAMSCFSIIEIKRTSKNLFFHIFFTTEGTKSTKHKEFLEGPFLFFNHSIR